MELTVIGYWGGYPKANEASSGYLLQQDDYYLLLDCGSGVLSKMQHVLPPERLNGVFISHYHADHIADIGVLQHARLITGLLGKGVEKLPIYAHSLDKVEFAKLTYKEITKGFAVCEEEMLEAGPFRARFLKTNHPADCFAIRLDAGGKSLVYTGDTSFKEELVSFTQDADLLLCECSFYGHQDGAIAGHMTSYDAGKLAEKANVKRMVLTHLPHYGDIEQLKKEAGEFYTGEISLAQSNLTIRI